MARARNTVAFLAALLAAHPAASAERDWVLARSRGFVVVSDAGDAKARQVAHQFEQVKALFAQVLQARVEPGRLVVIFAVRDEEGLRELLPAFWEAKGRSRPAGIFIPGRDKHLVALRLDTNAEYPYHVIYHEYTHLLTRLNVRWVPLWLDEGLAEFYGTADVDDKEVRWGRVYPPRVLYLRQAASLDLREVMGADHASSAYTHEASTPAFYAQSAILTHYLLVGAPQRRGQVPTFLKLLESGVDEPDARQQAFGDLKKLQGEADAYVRRSVFQGLKTPVQLDPQSIAVSPLTPAQAAALRGDFLARTGRMAEARPLLQGALRQDASLSWAEEGLGTLADSEGRSADALAHFVEAVRLAPENYVALFRAGRIRSPAAPADKDAARREQLLRRALHANPVFAPALSELAGLIGGRADRATEAIELAQKACALDPATVTHRLALWTVLRQAGRTDDAARAEADLLSLARRDREALVRMVAALEDQDRSADVEALLVKARAANPRSISVAQIVASFYDDRGRADEAEKVLRDALAVEPQSAMLMNDLAYTLAPRPGKGPEALDLVDKALKKEPKQPSFLDTRGFVLFHLKRLPEAETVLRAAAEALDASVVHEHLADVLQARGQTAEALAEYQRALGARDVEDRQRPLIEKKMAALRPSGPAVAASPSPAP